MKSYKILVPTAALLLLSATVNAQSEDAAERRAEQQREAVEKQREVIVKREEYGQRLREAEERMEAAAREIAEITRQRLPNIAQIERRIEFVNKPRLGVTISSNDNKDAVEGVVIDGVTPGSAADDAGLRAGDIITAVNGNSMSAESSMKANELLLKFMQKVDEGDKLRVDYRRNNNSLSVEVEPRVIESHAFTWVQDGDEIHVPNAPNIAVLPDHGQQFRMNFSFPFAGSVWGSLELVALNEGLGRYFGTDSGLLVVSAPKADGFEIQDGDVIQTIDSREPTDVRHAMRILSSYASGEKVKLGIMRDKKKRTLEVEIPSDHRGAIFAPPAVLPARALPAPKPPLPTAST